MSVLRTIEGKIEGLFEGVFGRAFRSHVQPVELARKLVKEMDDHRSAGVSRTYVPNRYVVYLSPGDRAQFAGFEPALGDELEQYLAAHAERQRYALLTPPTVELATDDDLAVGEFGIAVRVFDPRSAPMLPPPREPSVEAALRAPMLPAPAPAPAPDLEPPQPPVDPSATMVYRPTAPLDPESEEAPPVAREAITLRIGRKTHTVSSSRVVIGRSREADVQVADADVSRRHCELVQDSPTTWSIVDLGSTNGTMVNGKRVKRARVEDGDRITIGGAEIVFGRKLG
ncbi:MAG: FhaA domain-containing protein [Gaiella sp.]